MTHRRILLAALTAAAPWLQAAAPAIHLTPITPDKAAEPVVAGRPNAAAGLSYEASCSPSEPGLGLVRLQWQPQGAARGVQRVEVTAFPEGFATGRYSVSEPLEAGASEGLLERMEPGVNYYWRVLRRGDSGWLSSEVGRFEAPTCPVDRIIPAAR